MGQERARAQEFRRRLDALRSLLERRGDAAALLSSRVNFAWLTAGGTGHILQSSETAVVAMLVTRDDAVAITQNIEAARIADEELDGLDIEVVSVPWWEPGAIETEALRRLGTSRRAVRDRDLEPDLVGIRSVLSDFDRERMATLGQVARVAAEGALAAARPGLSENELVADLLGRLPGVRVPVLLAAADERLARYRHPLPGDTPIRSRVMLVLVAERWGLHVALTRIREFEPPGAELAATHRGGERRPGRVAWRQPARGHPGRRDRSRSGRICRRRVRRRMARSSPGRHDRLSGP